MDPLSIVGGVLALLQASIVTGNALKAFYDGTSKANAKVLGLITEVDGFSGVLRLMQATFQQEDVQRSLRATGHITNHLENLKTSIQDGQQTLLLLSKTLEKVNKSVSMLDGMRKHMRLKNAAEKIAIYQQQIRSYKETLHMTLQTIILWNQVSLRESTDLILPNLGYVQSSIRQIAEDINGQISSLQLSSNSSTTLEPDSEPKDEDLKLQNLRNLRNCLRSSATIVSSASTILSGGRSSEQISVTYASDFGDILPPEPAEPMRRWISSTSDYGYNQVSNTPPISSGPGTRKSKRRSLELIAEGGGAYMTDGSESDSELEAELVGSLLKQGKEKLASQDFEIAETKLRNCLSLIDSSRSSVPLSRTLESRSEITALLLSAYRHQEKWNAAQTLLKAEIALETRVSSKDSTAALGHTLALVEVLIKKFEYKEALKLGRQTFKGYRKLGPTETRGVRNSLDLLCRICKASGNYDQEDAYAALLSDLASQSPPATSPTMLRPDVARQSARHVSSGSTSSIDTSYNQGLAVRPIDETILTGRSGPKLTIQPLSYTQSVSTIKSSDIESWTTRQSRERDPPSPFTEYSFASSNPHEDQVTYKDTQAYPNYHHESSTPIIPDMRSTVYDRAYPAPTITSPVRTDEDFQSQQSRALFKAKLEQQIPTLLGTENIYCSTSGSQKIDPRLSDISLGSGDSITSDLSRSGSKSVPLARPHKPEHLRHGRSDPIPTQAHPTVDRPSLATKGNGKIISDPALPSFSNNGLPDSPRYKSDKKGKGVDIRNIFDHSESESEIAFNKQRPPARVNSQKYSGNGMRDSSESIEKPRFNPNNPFFRLTQTMDAHSVTPIRETVRGGIFDDLDTHSERKNDVIHTAATDILDIPQQHRIQANNSEQQQPYQPLRTSSTRSSTNPFLPAQRQSAIELFDAGVAELDVEVPRSIQQPPRSAAVDFAAFYAEHDAQEQRINRLMEMGFDRTKAVIALQIHNQNLTNAANYLAGNLVNDDHETVPVVQISTETVAENEDSDPEAFYRDDSNDHRSRRKLSDPPAYTASSSELLSPKVLSRYPSIDSKRSAASEDLETPESSSAADTPSEPERPGAKRAHVKKVSFGSPIPPSLHAGESSENRSVPIPTDTPPTSSEQPVHNQAFAVPLTTVSNADEDKSSSNTAANAPDTATTHHTSPPAVPSPRLVPGFIPPHLYTSEKEVVFGPTSPGLLSFISNNGSAPWLRDAGAPWPTELPRRKVAICGDVFCGKTSLISMFSKGIFPEAYNPSPLECTKFHKETHDKVVEFVLWDLGNDNDYDFYSDAHFVIICFSISDPGSLRLAHTKYVPLIKIKNPSVRYMLVGLKKDRRQNREIILPGVPEPIVTAAEGHITAVQMNAVNYMECSAKTGEGVTEVFDAVAGLAMMPSERISRMRSVKNFFERSKTGKKV